MVIVSSELPWSIPSVPKPSAAEALAASVCTEAAGPKPTGTSSRRPLRLRVGCPQGKGHQIAERMTNAGSAMSGVNRQGNLECEGHYCLGAVSSHAIFRREKSGGKTVALVVGIV